MKRAVFFRASCFQVLLFVFVAISTTAQESIWKQFSSANSGLPNESVKCITADQNGNIWVGTYMKGIGVYDHQEWKIYNTENSNLPHNYINCIEVDSENIIWIGTDGGGAARFDGENWTVFNYKNSDLPSDVVMDIECQPDGTVWIGTYFDGLAKFKNNQWTLYNTENSELLSNKIICLESDTNNALWAGTHGGGLVTYNGTNWKIFNERNSNLPTDYIYCVSIDDKNQKWIGTGGGGVALYNDIYWEIFDTHNSDLSDNNIRPCTLGKNGFIWTGTYIGGLVGFDGFQWYIYDNNNSSVPDDEINCLYYSNDTTLWIGTERNGIIVMQDTTHIIPIVEEEVVVSNTNQIIFDKGISEVVTPEPDTPAAEPIITETIEPTDIDEVYAQSRIYIVMNATDLHNNPSLEKLYLRSFKILLYEREQIDIDYEVTFVIFSSNENIKPQIFTLNNKQKELFFNKEIIYLDNIQTCQGALEVAYNKLAVNMVPEGTNQVMAATYYEIKGDKDAVTDLLLHHLDENNIKFTLLSFGPISWKVESEMRTMIPRGGGRYYKMQPVKWYDNWSATIQFGTSIFRGDMDVSKPVSFPGEIGFALNKKVISSGLLNGGIKGQFNFGEFSGRKNNYSFENKYKEGCLNFQVILNSWFNRTTKFEKFRPYAFAGVGFISYRALVRDEKGQPFASVGYEITGSNGNATATKSDAMTELIFPIGAGVNYKLSEVFALEAELSTRYIKSDKLDSWVKMKDDKYIFFSLGLTYKFREKEFLSNVLNK